jgi:hypothetical protein
MSEAMRFSSDISLFAVAARSCSTWNVVRCSIAFCARLTAFACSAFASISSLCSRATASSCSFV